ncbi:hypothetical protein E3N88_17989 [Mikania micrantha]|uniref:Uncharacterized protein n=1 Tax=Mikania micrantha TaxID=192012 RepID=A0A5N6NV69_9ASTR|nr:hypothetical protein E3N88_17989 [Mikania micrantha]
MGSEQFYGFRLTGERSSYSSPNQKIEVGPTTPIESQKFEAHESPNCPLSTPFDSDTFTILSSGASPSFGDCSSFNQSGSIHYMKNALQDIETTLMAPDEEVSMPMNPPSAQTRWSQHEPTSSIMVHPQAAYSPGYSLSGNNANINLKQLLIACASALAGNKINEFEILVERARALVSITGDPIQRLGAYMVEGLVARRELSEVLDYYSAMFESIDTILARDRKERINVEQHCLARDIVNVIACEGTERVERHELFRKWRSRLTMAGFTQHPMSMYVNSVIRDLLKCYSEHYTLVEKDGAMLLGWKDRNLISASAWY